MRLRTLGGCNVEESLFKQQKSLLLLAYLAIEGSQERRHVAELFYWNSTNPLNSLASALSRMRKAVPGAIDADDKRVWASLSCDANEFVVACREAKLELASELYQGRFLEGVYQKDWNSELEEWVYSTREKLADQMRANLLASAELQASTGRFEDAALQAEKAYLLRGAPEPEADGLKRLYLLLKAGEHPQASEVLKEATAFDPSLVLSSQEARRELTQASRPERAPQVLHNLPGEATPFIGREADLASLRKQLQNRACRLISIVAPGGFGKTRLAMAVAREWRGRYRDGVWLVPLLTVASTELIVYAIAERVGFRFFGHREPKEQLFTYLEDKEMLLVLDNLEHLLAGAELFSELLERARKLTLLTTSRERLHLHAEWVFDLEGLSVPRENDADVRSYDAVVLFSQTALQHQRGFRLVDSNLEAVTETCRLVGGMPLAIEIAASWLRVLSPADIAKELRQGIDVLEAKIRDIPPRHQSIRAVFDHSWNLLSEQERHVLRALSIFQGGFGRNAAIVVADVDLNVLASLADKALLGMDAWGRWSLHPLVREYAQEKLVADAREYSEVRARHGTFYLDLIQQAHQERWSSKAGELLLRFDDEIENIWASLHWAVAEKQLDQISICAESMLWYVDIRCRYQEAITQFASIIVDLDPAEPSHRVATGNLTLRQGSFYLRSGQYQKGKQTGLSALSLLPEDRFAEMEGQVLLGNLALMIGEFEQARQHFASSVSLATTLGDDGYLVINLKNLAHAEFALGFKQKSLERIQEALAISKRENNTVGLVIVLSHLGVLSIQMGQVDKANPILEEGLLLARELGFEQEIARLLKGMGLVAFKEGDFRGARALFEESSRVVQESGHRQFEASVLASLGRTYLRLAMDDRAHAVLLQAMSQTWASRELPTVLELLTYLAEAESKAGGPDQAGIWLNLVLEHPAAPQWLKEEAATVLAAANLQVSSAPEEASPSGVGVTLDHVVEQLLAQPFGGHFASHHVP